MSRGEHPAWRIRLNHLLAKSLRATIAASRRLRHQNRLRDKRDIVYLKGIGNIKHGMNRWTNRCAQTAETGAIHLYIYIHLRRVERTPGAISPARIARVIDQNWARNRVLLSTARGMARCPFARQAAHPGYGSMPIHPPSVSTHVRNKATGNCRLRLQHRQWQLANPCRN